MRGRVLNWVMAFGFGISFVLTGCATLKETDAQHTERLLIAAGFTTKVPTTPEGEAKFKVLKPFKMVKGMREGKVVYVYPDPQGCGCAYVGGEQQYADYRYLVLQEETAAVDALSVETTADPLDEWW
jgi:hypothetical protein